MSLDQKLKEKMLDLFIFATKRSIYHFWNLTKKFCSFGWHAQVSAIKNMIIYAQKRSEPVERSFNLTTNPTNQIHPYARGVQFEPS